MALAGGSLAALVLSDLVAVRWLLRLTRDRDALRERVARLEGRLNGR